MPSRVSISCGVDIPVSAHLGGGFQTRPAASTVMGDPGRVKNPPYSLCPRVAAAREEAVLVVVGGGFPRRFDNCDLGERRLHRRSLVDGVEPARKIGTIVPFDALRVVIARPRKSRDIGNR